MTLHPPPTLELATDHGPPSLELATNSDGPPSLESATSSKASPYLLDYETNTKSNAPHMVWVPPNFGTRPHYNHGGGSPHCENFEEVERFWGCLAAKVSHINITRSPYLCHIYLSFFSSNPRYNRSNFTCCISNIPPISNIFYKFFSASGPRSFDLLCRGCHSPLGVEGGFLSGESKCIR